LSEVGVFYSDEIIAVESQYQQAALHASGILDRQTIITF
jgi:mannose-1-phosphate guanylyltransferase